MITVIGLHLRSYVALLEYNKNRYEAWRKHNDYLDLRYKKGQGIQCPVLKQ